MQSSSKNVKIDPQEYVYQGSALIDMDVSKKHEHNSLTFRPLSQRLTRKLLPSFPGITGNFQEFEGNQLTEKLLPSFPGIPGIIHEDEYY